MIAEDYKKVLRPWLGGESGQLHLWDNKDEN